MPGASEQVLPCVFDVADAQPIVIATVWHLLEDVVLVKLDYIGDTVSVATISNEQADARETSAQSSLNSLNNHAIL